MNTINYSFVVLCLALICGLLWGHYFPHAFSGIAFSIGFWVFLFVLWIWNQRRDLPFGIVTAATFLAFFCFSYGNYQQQLPAYQEKHFSNLPLNPHDKPYHVRVQEILKPSLHHTKYLAEVQWVGSLPAKGKLLLTMEKDSAAPSIEVDEELLVYGNVSTIAPPLNPYQFNYKNYMASLGVFGELSFQKSQILSSRMGPRSLRGTAERFRSYLIRKLQKSVLKKRERDILQALVLGEKRALDKSLYENYAAAGAVHILAVSGLHVGILLFLFHGLLQPLERFRQGKYLKTFLILCLLWGFAFIAGLSPSVVRAVTMFSFLSIALVFRRKQNTYNTLLLSLFILLLVRPLWLFQVGFQLSYLAVFFILWVQPKITSLYRPKNRFFKYFWNLMSVSLAAQIGVAPLSIYYFHQFPGLFFVTNLLILPFLGLILGYGILVMGLTGLGWNILWLEEGLQFILHTLNELIIWIASKNQFVFDRLSLSLEKMMLCYAFIVSLFLFWKTRNRKWTFTLLTIGILFLGHSAFEKSQSKESLVVFQKTRKTLMACVTSEEILLMEKAPFISANQEPLKSFLLQKNKSVKHIEFPSVWKDDNHTYVVLDSLGVFPKIEGAVLLFTDSPKINLERLIDSLKPKVIVADGSNYRSYVARWQATCQKRRVPFHSTYQDGAFVTY